MQWEKFGPRPVAGTYWLYLEEEHTDDYDWSEGTATCTYDPPDHWVILANIYYTPGAPEDIRVTPIHHETAYDDTFKILAVMRLEDPAEPDPNYLN